MLTASGLHLTFGAQTILRGAEITLEDGAVAGLVGANGSGKTSLLRILVGEQTPEAGTVQSSRETTIGYLKQSFTPCAEDTPRSIADEGFAREHALVQRRELCAAALEKQPENSTLLHEVAAIDDALTASGYHHREREIEPVLTGLGFAPTDFDRPITEFSGGWQLRAALARTLLSRAHYLLLDEPTNYLDSEARLWLIRFIRQYRGSILLVSHDRAFLDDTISVVFELFDGKIRRYRGTYSEYERQRSEEIERLKRAWTEQQREIQRQEDFIRRFRATASRAKQVQSRIKMLATIERIEIPEHLRPISISLPPATPSGSTVLKMNEVTRAYGTHVVIDALTLELHRGQRLAVTGLNGAGKSTLLRMCAQIDTPDAGTLTSGTNVSVAYFAQDSADTIISDETVRAFLTRHAPAENLRYVDDILGAFLFGGDASEKPLRVLSGGERSRLVIASLLIRPANLLILDEPTNHLDIASQDVLAHALGSYQGTVIVVSHDRDFLRRITTDVLALWPTATRPPEVPNGWRFYPGSFSEFELSHMGQVFLSEQTRENATGSGSQMEAAFSRDNRSATDYAAQKAKRAQIRQLERRESELIERQDELERAHQSIQLAMADEANYTDATRISQLQQELTENEAQQATVLEEWETTADELRALRGDDESEIVT